MDSFSKLFSRFLNHRHTGVSRKDGDVTRGIAGRQEFENLELTDKIWSEIAAPSTAYQLGSVKQPTFDKTQDNGDGSTGVYGWHFAPDTEQQLFYTAMLPFNYVEDTDLILAFHWEPTTAEEGTVVWGVEYTWCNNGNNDVYPDTQIVTVEGETNGVVNQHLSTPVDKINGEGRKIRSGLKIRMFRDADDSRDTYPSDAILLQFGIRHRVNRLGSEEVYFGYFDEER